MDIHKPKPWHGVREFLKEYVIIVVGVLTALGAEQGVEWLHWRHQIELAHEALAFDMKRVMGWAGLEDARARIGARLTELDASVDKAQETSASPRSARSPSKAGPGHCAPGRASPMARSWPTCPTASRPGWRR